MSRTAAVVRREFDGRTVVAGKDHQRIIVQPVLAQALHDLAHAPVEFLDGIAVAPGTAGTFELLRCHDRQVRIGMRQEQEERFVAVLPDIFPGPLGIHLRQVGPVSMFLEHLLILHERQRPVVVGRIKSVEIVETVVVRQVGMRMALMPLADERRRVTRLAHHIGEGDLLFGKPPRGIGKEHALAVAVHARTHRVARRE